MDRATWIRLNRLFEKARGLAAPARQDFLDRELAEAPALRSRLEAMLEADASEDSFLQGQAADWVTPARAAGDEVEDPRWAGSYRLIERLGSGGMGEVWLGERSEGHLRMRAAVKVLRRGLDTDFLLERFLIERQTLANLQHRNIARLLDGGALEDGRPYLVMDYVPGQPIDEYCRSKRLTTRATLELLLDVIAAVDHAHQKLVVHCDLKPANILVTDEGEPRLLDFGIAKLLDAEPEIGRTWRRNRPHTGRYASPEQIRGEPLTTATDVYSLGVVLYEILTGRHPFADSAGARDRAIPPAPSRVVCEGSAASTTATGRLPRDLDAIILTAMHPEPASRYASVQRLGDDIRRHLCGFPVESRTPSWTYRASKFARRHRAGLAATVLLVACVIGGFAGLAWRASVAEEQRVLEAKARREVQKALSESELARNDAGVMASFMENLLTSADPTHRNPDVTVREVVDRAAESVAAEFAGRPALEASARVALARSYLGLANHTEAREQLDRSLEIRSEVLEAEHPSIAEVHNLLGHLFYQRQEFREALDHMKRALAIQERAYGPRHESIALSLNDQAVIYKSCGQYEKAEALYTRALEMRRELFGDEHVAVAVTLNNLGNLYCETGELDRAEECHRQVLAIREEQLPIDHPLIAQSLSNLAAVSLEKGELDDAAGVLTRVLELHRDQFGNDHPYVAIALANLAVTYGRLGSPEQAEPLWRESVTIERRSGPATPSLASAEVAWGHCLAELGRFEEAEPLLTKNVETLERIYGPDHARTRQLLAWLVEMYESWGRPAKAAEFRSRLE